MSTSETEVQNDVTNEHDAKSGDSAHNHEESSFVETALELSGKSQEEATRTGAIDRADEQVESLFDRKYQTAGSPIHQAVWDRHLPTELFARPDLSDNPTVERVMSASLEVVASRKLDNTLLGKDGRITDDVLEALSGAGYWGLLVPAEYGGSGSSFGQFARFLSRMATLDATVAGLASVHGCIGAVDPLIGFGTADQKSRYLPRLARGDRISAFALTEPGAGSDLTALRTTAVLDGDDYVINGEKLFITNAIPGRTIGLVCKIDNRPAVLIADLPSEENEQFQLVPYGLYALKHSFNNGLRFSNFRVPRANLLEPSTGDGLTIAYHGLNRGRVALCATAAGSMRVMLAGMKPWAAYRSTYGQPIARRELVQRRLGRLASLIVGCDALVDWCSWQLDEGYRGEMECIVAKIFGSEAQKDAAIELCMKTHGGRAFLHGHMIGDNIHEFLAPCIYEGEGEMLGLAFLKSLVKEHGRKFFEPIGRRAASAGLQRPNPANPLHAWTLRREMASYAAWKIRQWLAGWQRPRLDLTCPRLARLARFAADGLQSSRLRIDGLMVRHQLKLPDRQVSMATLSQQIQDFVVILVSSLWADAHGDPLVRDAAVVLGNDLRSRLTGKPLSGQDVRTVTKLGAAIAEEDCVLLEDVVPHDILMQYDADSDAPASS